MVYFENIFLKKVQCNVNAKFFKQSKVYLNPTALKLFCCYFIH